MQEIIKTLSWTFIHSLWQGLLGALLAAIIISTTRKASARLRYYLLSIVMILFLTASVITFIKQWHLEATAAITYAGFTISTDVALINSSSVMDNIINWINTNSGPLVLVWSIFFLLHCLRLITGLAAINRLRHNKTHPVNIEWMSKIKYLQLLIGIRRSVTLLQSELVKVPTALGFLKPVILLPLGMLAHLPPEQVETILLHELAHIRRKDYLINLLQHVAEAIFFFNPAMRWVSSLIRQEREACCDDIVIANCKQKTKYLEALINFQEYSLGQTCYALGISSRRHYLLNRVKRMVTNKNKGVGMIERIALLGGLFLFSAFSFATKEKEVKQAPAVIQQQLPATNSPTVQGKPELPSIKKENKKINSVSLRRTITDTVPLKKDTMTKGNEIPVKDLPEKMKEPQKPITDPDKTLQEIVKIKVQIGLKKESIGARKEQLKTADEKEKQKILKEIDRERDELEEQRDELEQKREKWQELKKEAQNKPKMQKIVGEKIVVDKDKIAAVQKINNLTIAPPKKINTKTDLKIENSKNYDINIDKQEYQYKMHLQQKISPPRVESKDAPQKIKSPAAPTKKVRQS